LEVIRTFAFSAFFAVKIKGRTIGRHRPCIVRPSSDMLRRLFAAQVQKTRFTI
jgi:hypothetical protein